MRTVSGTLDSTLASIDDGEKTALEFARRVGFVDSTLECIGFAVREMIANAVVHGNRYDPRKKVFLACSNTARRLVIAISDQGDGFELNRVPNPVDATVLLQSSGRGIYLARAFMDEFHVRSNGKTGTTVVLVKYLNGRHAESASGN